jgi:hypothetical protein
MFEPGRADDISAIDAVPEYAEAVKCKALVDTCVGESERSSEEWATNLEPWEKCVEKGRELFGEQWRFCVLANVAAGIKSKAVTCANASSLLDQSVPLCQRARHARLRASNVTWWEDTLNTANADLNSEFALLLCLTWGGPTVLAKLLPVLAERLGCLSEENWRRLQRALYFPRVGHSTDITLDLQAIPEHHAERLIVAMEARLTKATAQEAFAELLADYSGNDKPTLEFCWRMAVHYAMREPNTWERWLPIIKASYQSGAISDLYLPYRYTRAVEPGVIPTSVAEEIVAEANRYPTDLVGFAEQICRERVAESVVPVGEVAERDKWFSN